MRAFASTTFNFFLLNIRYFKIFPTLLLNKNVDNVWSFSSIYFEFSELLNAYLYEKFFFEWLSNYIHRRIFFIVLEIKKSYNTSKIKRHIWINYKSYMLKCLEVLHRKKVSPIFWIYNSIVFLVSHFFIYQCWYHYFIYVYFHKYLKYIMLSTPTKFFG